MSIHNRKDDYIDSSDKFESNCFKVNAKKFFLKKYFWDCWVDYSKPKGGKLKGKRFKNSVFARGRKKPLSFLKKNSTIWSFQKNLANNYEQMHELSEVFADK